MRKHERFQWGSGVRMSFFCCGASSSRWGE
nr:MAG TPA: hypothetical protein [Caudoviricetes sp.]